VITIGKSGLLLEEKQIRNFQSVTGLVDFNFGIYLYIACLFILFLNRLMYPKNAVESILLSRILYDYSFKNKIQLFLHKSIDYKTNSMKIFGLSI